MKENVLIVGDYNREDFLYVAKVIHEDFNVYFLEYTHRNEIKSDHYKKWGQAIFWGQFKDAFELLEVVKPKWVLFYFIESFNHVALNVTCKYVGVKTYHMEHGIRSYELLESNINQRIIKNEKPFDLLKKLRNIKSRIKGRMFFQKTVEKLPTNYKTFLIEYFQVRGSNSIFETFQKISSPFRVADCYISFSPKIFEFHQKSDHLPENHPVKFIGCPSFDNLVESSTTLNSRGANILFIDNAFETQKLFGWNNQIKMEFLDQLVDFAISANKKIWIKPHPYSDPCIYAKSKKNPSVNYINSDKEFRYAVLDCRIILGFYSTLLMPLMAFNDTICFSLEMHPNPAKEGLSTFLVESGAIRKIISWKELGDVFNCLDVEANKQKTKKQQFIDDWLYKFDGKSTERLRTILVQNEAA